MRGFRIGSVFGIEIRIDYSWFVIFVLILWTLTRGVFPAAHPGEAPLTYIFMGLSGTLLFFASLLAHELSHSLVARSRDIPVHSITLFIFGGVARTTSEFETPGDEFAIAAAGPVCSLAIAALFQALAWISAATGLPEAVTGVASYLALINFVLVVFNMFPGFPLDGGRLFRAAIWKRTGDVRRATRIATNGGKVFGYMLMVLGFLNLFGGNGLGGIWLVFIGWFVRMAAESSYVQHVLRRSLEGAHARDVMTPDPLTIDPGAGLPEFVEDFVLEGRHHSYPVAENGRALGVITLDRVRAVPKADWPSRTVADAMLPLSPDIVVQPDASMADTMQKVNDSSVGRVLVADGDRLLGIISQADIARWLERQRLREEVSAA
ncbi:MAG: site-2 protease family protein [Gemmatimonadetes bacterium]|nr:site-2 protease family protein [Gemmatimonadota bacterium]